MPFPDVTVHLPGQDCQALKSKESFLEIVYLGQINNLTNEQDGVQLNLF